MSENFYSTISGTHPSLSCYWNPTGEKKPGKPSHKTRTMRKPINFLIVNMAMSDLLFPIFLISRDIQLLYVNSWLIGGPLGKVLCKLVNF